MACEDTRQLTEAQRVAAYQQQRTGVTQAVRPFSGRPTIENLIDYINRELQPAVKRTRDKVNDVYLQVTDNAPSGNPLSFYFSTETAAADPTVGRIRLNAATQDTGTIVRVSQSNGRLVDVAPWLDVMAGGATTPLGVVTLTDAINPARFIRFDLNTMTDQGVYWDLGVTPIESSHDNPFVDGGAVVLSFIPGVGGVTPATVPASSLSPIAANTVIGNPTGSTAAPQAIAVAASRWLGRGSTGNFGAQTGAIMGEIVRRSSWVVDSTSTGSIATYVVSETLTQVNFKISGAITIHGMTAVDGKTLEFSIDQAFGGTVTFAQDSAGAGASNQRVRCPAGVDFVLHRGETCIATYFDSRWRIVGVGKVVRRRFPGEPIYDVMDEPFNAAGDGTTDDTAAINAAIAAANLVPGAVYLGDRHRITAALTPLANNDIALIGRGKFNGGTILSLDVGSTLPDPVISVTGQYCIVRGFWLVTTYASATSRGIVLSAFQPLIEDVTISSFGVPFEVDRCNTARLINCGAGDILGAYGYHVHGVNPDFCHNTQFQQCGAGQTYPLTLGAGRGAWAAGTAYTLGQVVRANGGLWQCSTAGTSSGAGSGPSGLPSTNPSLVHVTPVTDGSAQWRFAMGAFAGFGHGSFAHTVMYDRCGVLQGNYGMHVFDDQGDAPTFIHGWQFSVDHPFERGILIEACDGAVWFDQTLVTSVLSSTGVGIELEADALGWQFSGGQVFGTGREGIIVSGRAGKIHNMEVAAAGVLTANTYDGIRIDATAVDIGIVGCTSGDAPGTASIARYGISVAAGADEYVIADNNLIGNDTGPLLNTPGQSTTRVVRNNLPKWADHVASDGVETFSLAAGTHTLTLAATTNVVFVIPTGAVIVDQIVHGAGNAGVEIIVHKEGTAGTLALRDGNASANSIWTPNAVDYVFTAFNDAARLESMTNSGGFARWRVQNTGRLALRKNSTGSDFTRRRVNLIEGPGITLTFADDSTNEEIDVTITGGVVSDGDKGDITVSSSGTVWTIDNDVVTFAKMQNIGYGVVGNPTFATTVDPTIIAPTGGFQVLYDNNAGGLAFALLVTGNYSNASVTDAKISNRTALSVFGRSANSAGVGADIAATATGFGVLRENGSGVLGFGLITTSNVTDGTVTNAKRADMAQSRFSGRAEGAGTGAPQDLTPTQAVAIIDAESPTWTGSHDFTGATHTVTATGALSMQGDSDVGLASVSGGLALGAGTVIVSPSVGNGDVVINATGGVAITAGGSPISDAAADDVLLQAADDVRLTAVDQVLITSASVEVSASTSVTVATENFILSSGGLCLTDIVSSTTATENNFSVAGSNVARFNGTTTLTGMVPSADGQLAVIVNAHASNVLAIENEHAGSSAANRFALDTTTRWVRPTAFALAWYDGTTDRWRLLSGDRTFTL